MQSFLKVSVNTHFEVTMRMENSIFVNILREDNTSQHFRKFILILNRRMLHDFAIKLL